MIVWKDYLAMLAEDGVLLGQAEEQALTDQGERVVAYFLSRHLDQRLLHIPLPVTPAPDATVPSYLQRQIAVALRLPPEKYIFYKL
jgi:hypothetical protein